MITAFWDYQVEEFFQAGFLFKYNIHNFFNFVRCKTFRCKYAKKNYTDCAKELINWLLGVYNFINIKKCKIFLQRCKVFLQRVVKTAGIY